MQKKHCVFILYFIFTSGIFVANSPAKAQIFYNKGGIVYTAPGSILQFNGGIENADSGIITHHGTMWVTKNSTLFPNPGNVMLNSGSLMQGNGIYWVQQDWFNNARFICDNSTVELHGNTRQYITGSEPTRFNILTLTGFGGFEDKKKTMVIDSRISTTGALNLNDRELETQEHSMFVENTSLSAITRSSTLEGGFVSSTTNGSLVRYTDQIDDYLFPVGSSDQNLRYRPVDVHPNSTTASEFGVRLANNNPNNDGLSTTNGSISGLTDVYNLNFYHTVTRNKGDGVYADLSVHYDSYADGNYTGMYFWDDEKKQWRNAMNTSIGPVKYFGYASERRSLWPFTRANDKHFILVREGSGMTDSIPNIFTIDGDGINETLHITSRNLKSFTLMIYNRWGNLIFESNSPEIDWDGRTLAGSEVPGGVYFYILKYTDENDEQKNTNGTFTLVR